MHVNKVLWQFTRSVITQCSQTSCTAADDVIITE